MNASCTRLVTGASDNQLRVWELSTQEGKADSAAAMAVDGEEEEESGDGGGAEEDIVAVYMGSVARQGNGEISRVFLMHTFFRVFGISISCYVLCLGFHFLVVCCSPRKPPRRLEERTEHAAHLLTDAHEHRLPFDFARSGCVG